MSYFEFFDTYGNLVNQMLAYTYIIDLTLLIAVAVVGPMAITVILPSKCVIVTVSIILFALAPYTKHSYEKWTKSCLHHLS